MTEKPKKETAKEKVVSSLPKKKEAIKPVPVANKESKPKKHLPNVNLFGKWPCDVTVKDPGLVSYLNISPTLLPRSAGSHRKRFHKSKMHIVERLALHLMVPGHTGKRHRLTSGRMAGGYIRTMGIVEKAFDIIEKKEKKNPLEVFIRALENAALREEITSYQMGSIVARDAVITAPQRRIDKTLRIFAQSAYKKSFNKKKSIENSLAEELIAAYHGSSESMAIKEKERIEHESAGAR